MALYTFKIKIFYYSLSFTLSQPLFTQIILSFKALRLLAGPCRQ